MNALNIFKLPIVTNDNDFLFIYFPIMDEFHAMIYLFNSTHQ
jgi:hypothetical protein